MGPIPLALRGYRTDEVDAFLDRCVGLVDLPPRHDGRPRSYGSSPPTADECRYVLFGRAFRGYAMNPVDDLLDAVAAEVERRG